MVFMKKANKGGKPNQKAQVKKPFKKADIDMSDDDFDDDSDSDDNDVIVTKTPKGKQSLGDKRVSFQVPGKNTPVGKNTPGKTPVGKKQATPAKGNSVAKKQATPGKEGLQKFKGMEKQNKNSKKGSQPEDDDDDDDSDDDDDDEEFSLGGGLDLKMKGFDEDDDDDDDEDDDDDNDDEDDDDEDDDDDDDDEDDDDDDDDEDDEEEINQKNSQNGKKQKVVQAKQTPIKANEKTPKGALTPKTAQTPKAAQTPKSKDDQTLKSIKKESNAVSPVSTNAVALLEEERRKERDAKQLYMGNLPKDVTEEEIKKLSPDILSATIHVRSKSKRAFAFLQFASEEKAEENLVILKSKLFKGATLNVDYAGYKSSKQSPQQLKYDLKRLYVPGLPLDVTVHQISKFFPKSHTVSIGRGNTFKAATITFSTEEDATAAFNESKDLKINGVKVSVLHSTNSRLANKRKNTKKNKNDGHPGKKMKLMKQEESDEE